MKTTILIKENRTQLVLHPENEHDNSVVKILEKLPNTHRTNLYDRQGGFTMFSEYANDNIYGGSNNSNKDLMIVFDEPAQPARGEKKETPSRRISSRSRKSNRQEDDVVDGEEHYVEADELKKLLTERSSNVYRNLPIL